MAKFYFLGCCLLLLFGCNNAGVVGADTNSQTDAFAVDSLPGKAVVNTGARELLKGWEAFGALEQSIDALYRVGNKEELRLLLDELIEKEKAVEASAYPEAFDNPQVRSRQKVFKTYLLKTKANLEYRVDPMGAAKEMIGAFNAICREFSIVSNSTLDIKILQDE